VSAGLFEDLGDFYAKAGNSVVDEFVSFVEKLSLAVRMPYLYGPVSRVHVPH
jgi:hypothetical protein